MITKVEIKIYRDKSDSYQKVISGQISLEIPQILYNRF
jgi:hypothetical protein